MALAGTPDDVREQVTRVAGVGGVNRIILLPQVPGQDFVQREQVLRLRRPGDGPPLAQPSRRASRPGARQAVVGGTGGG